MYIYMFIYNIALYNYDLIHSIGLYTALQLMLLHLLPVALFWIFNLTLSQSSLGSFFDGDSSLSWLFNTEDKEKKIRDTDASTRPT